MSLFIQKCWMDQFQWNKTPKVKSSKLGHVYVLTSADSQSFQKIIQEKALKIQKDELSKNERDLVYFISDEGPVWILRLKNKTQNHEGSFQQESFYSATRDLIGSLVSHFKAHHLQVLNIKVIHGEADMIRGALIGLEMGYYQFKELHLGAKSQALEVYFQLENSSWTAADLKKTRSEAMAINQARHLVNLPPNVVNPVSLATAIQKKSWPQSVKVHVLNETQIKKEKMNLLMAVGQGAESAPRFVHIKYRPAGVAKNKKLKPLAFVGKGITFDTGGLDIKPSSGMRLMKKDMGGAAVVLSLAQWAAETQFPRACDFYLCLAENSVDGRSFRPSDVIQSRAGHWVEIDNTDAEGRLVLADGLDYAVTQKEEPEFVIDVATLTGAIKVALGTDVSGLFSNQDQLADLIFQSGLESGDYCWRMPLVEKYFSGLSSGFADFKNCGESFGGAITAALFLQKFVKKIPWAHLDIYAWSDRAQGPYANSGGNGQAVQSLIQFCKTQVLR